MKRNRFRLATVMRVRQIQEDTEMGRLTQARLTVHRAQTRQAECIEAYRRAAQPDDGKLSSSEFVRERDKFERLGQQVVSGANEVTRAVDEERLRRHDWSIAAQRVSALDRLRERNNAAYEHGMAVSEIVEADERTNQRRFHTQRLLNAPYSIAPEFSDDAQPTEHQVA